MMVSWRKGAWRAAMGCVALSLVLGGCWSRLRRDDRPVVAMVGSMPIYLDEFKKEYARVRLAADGGGESPPESNAAQKKALLDDMVDERLLLIEAGKNNVTVPTDAVEAAYARLRGGWKDDEFAAELKAKDLTPVELKASLRDKLKVRKYLSDNVFARVAVTDAEIDGYVKAHPDTLATQERVHARQIVLKTEDQAQKVAGELGHGLSFEDAAMKYSLGPEGKSGGDLGTFGRGLMPESFETVCFALKTGEVSKVVASPYGFHLFKLIEHFAAKELTLADVRSTVESTLRHAKEWEAQAQRITALRAGTAVVVKEEQLAQVME